MRGPIRRSNAVWHKRRQPKPWWLWVPACAGTTAESHCFTSSKAGVQGLRTRPKTGSPLPREERSEEAIQTRLIALEPNLIQRLGNLEKKSQITAGESKSSSASGMACPPFCTEYKMTE